MSAASFAPPATAVSRFTDISELRGDEFVSKGWPRRYFFPHRIRRLPKCGPDGYKLGLRMCGSRTLDHQWQVVLYAAPQLLAGLPRDLFFDRDVVWHEQHLGLPGQVASANVLLEPGRAYSYVHQSDLVQRIGRRREHKTRIDGLFGGWPRMLLNAVLGFAADRGAGELRVPTAALAMRHTDPARDVALELFERVHDRCVSHLEGVREEDGWWVIDVERNRERVVSGEQAEMPLTRPERIVCLCHDIERGFGHGDVKPGFAREADDFADAALEAMLAAEAEAGVRATYNVVGAMLADVRQRIEAGGHALGFHSWDHGEDDDQLERCRALDYRLKGYRPPRSLIGPDLADERLAEHNFEWLASSRHSLGIDAPALRGRLVKVPIHMDDFALHSGSAGYAGWERAALAAAEARPFTALSLHDCYAPNWLPGYDGLLERLLERAELWTVDEVAAHVTLASGE